MDEVAAILANVQAQQAQASAAGAPAGEGGAQEDVGGQLLSYLEGMKDGHGAGQD